MTKVYVVNDKIQAGRTDVGDCGKSIGLGYAIASTCSIIPWIGAPLGLTALVLLILNLVRYNDLKRRS